MAIGSIKDYFDYGGVRQTRFYFLFFLQSYKSKPNVWMCSGYYKNAEGKLVVNKVK